MPIIHRTIDVIAPIGPAIERVKTMLFRPFDLSKWLAVGFCAWLAWLGESWGGGPNLNIPSGRRRGGPDFDEFGRFIMSNLAWLIPLAAAIVFIGLVLWLLFAWLSSRGRFMFTNSVARNTGEIAQPWTRYARQGDSLFLFRVCLALLSLVTMVPVLVAGVLTVIAMVEAHGFSFLGLLALIGIACVFFALALLFLVISKLLGDFVVPVMMLREVTVVPGWREFIGLVSGHKAALLLYLLFQVVIQFATGLIVLVAVIVTCCLAGCLLMVPYIGTVVLLPILVFERAYSLYYLAQFGPAYDVFAAPSPQAPPAPPPQPAV